MFPEPSNDAGLTEHSTRDVVPVLAIVGMTLAPEQCLTEDHAKLQFGILFAMTVQFHVLPPSWARPVCDRVR